MYFDSKAVAATFGILIVLLFLIKKRQWVHASSRLFFSDVQLLKGHESSFKLFWNSKLKFLLLGSMLCLCAGFMDPHLRSYTNVESRKRFFSPKEGVGIYLVLDQSGSMREKGSLLIQKSQKQELTKMDLLKVQAGQFVQNRPNDLIGLVGFARFPTILSPLTLNHQNILNQLDSLQVVKELEKDGTAIGYALYKTAHLIASTQEYYLKEGEKLETAIILVSDGLQDPNPLDRGHAFRAMELEEAAAFAKKNNIKIYMINLEPRLKEKRFEPNLKQLQRIAQMTGGQFFLADGSNGIHSIFQQIDALEKHKITTPDEQQYYEKKMLYAYLVVLTLVLAGSYMVLKLTFFKQVP
ncbi:putative batA protein [Chlamydiales bacterium STE3]|nr:putative batA protein [Chlamydiales bacterium STE3]